MPQTIITGQRIRSRSNGLRSSGTSRRAVASIPATARAVGQVAGERDGHARVDAAWAVEGEAAVDLGNDGPHGDAGQRERRGKQGAQDQVALDDRDPAGHVEPGGRHGDDAAQVDVLVLGEPHARRGRPASCPPRSRRPRARTCGPRRGRSGRTAAGSGRGRGGRPRRSRAGRWRPRGGPPWRAGRARSARCRRCRRTRETGASAAPAPPVPARASRTPPSAAGALRAAPRGGNLLVRLDGRRR